MRTAVIVIDVQESFRRRPTWAELSNPAVVERNAELVRAAREAGHEVIWVLHAEPGSDSVFDPASGFVRLIDGLEALPGETTVVKTSRNAFTTTNLGQHLTASGTRRLVISGIQTEQCCETTARLAADLGFEVVFVTEATATFPITRPDTGEVLPADEVVARTEFALAGRFARISSVEDALTDNFAAG